MRVMFYNGVTREGPLSLPTSATKKLDGSGTISKITNEADAIACGYYRIELATATAGYVIVSTAWPDEPDKNNVFVQTITSEITQAEYDQAQKDDSKAIIATALADPVQAVLVRAIRFLGGLHGFTAGQVNTKLTEWINEEVT